MQMLMSVRRTLLFVLKMLTVQTLKEVIHVLVPLVSWEMASSAAQVQSNYSMWLLGKKRSNFKAGKKAANFKLKLST